MTDDILYEIAKIIDNEYIGKRKTFTAKRVRSCWHLSTNVCDFASFIKVWERDNKISSIERLGEDTDSWQPIMPNTWARIETYLNTLNERQIKR